MSEIQKKEFIQSLKRLKSFFNNLKTYEPDEKVLQYRDFIKEDFSQPKYYLMESLQKQFVTKTPKNQKMQIEEEEKQKTVLFNSETQPDDEQFVKNAMTVTQSEIVNKQDQEWFEEASNAIRQAKKFQFLIQKQENSLYLKQIQEKQKTIDTYISDINDLKDQLGTLEKNIDERKNVGLNIKKQMREEEVESNRILKQKNQLIQELKRDTESRKKKYKQHQQDIDFQLDNIRHYKHHQENVFEELQQHNNMMYFFPTKVEDQNERIERKQVELNLSKKIISETLSFMKQRIQETKQKQILVNQLNSYVGSQIQNALDIEMRFYLSSDRDKLKAPPYVTVKRLQRPGVDLPPRQTMILDSPERKKSPNKDRKPSRSKSNEKKTYQ